MAGMLTAAGNGNSISNNSRIIDATDTMIFDDQATMGWEFCTRPEPPRRSNARPAEWAQHRQQIAALYRKHTLSRVMEIMGREHDFWASEKMYKDRLRIWKLNTKNKKPHTRKSKNQRISEAHHYRAQLDMIQQHHYRQHHPAAPDPVLNLPDFDEAQVILASTRSFLQLALANERWSVVGTGRETIDAESDPNIALWLKKTRSNQYDGIMRLPARLKREWYRDATLDPSTCTIDRLVSTDIETPAPALVWRLLALFRRMEYAEDRDKVKRTLQLVASKSRSDFSPNYPLTLISAGLAVQRGGGRDILSLFAKILECMRDTLDTTIGPYSGLSVAVAEQAVRGNFTWGDLDLTGHILAWEKLLGRLERALGLADWRVLGVRLEYLSLLRFAKRVDRFHLEFRRSVAITAALPFRSCAKYRGLLMKEVADFSYEQRLDAEAEEYMREALRIFAWNGRALKSETKLAWRRLELWARSARGGEKMRALMDKEHLCPDFLRVVFGGICG